LLDKGDEMHSVNCQAWWGNGLFFRCAGNFGGGTLKILDQKFSIYGFWCGNIEVEFTDIEKIIYAKKPLYPYILVIPRNKQKKDLNMIFIVKPEKVLNYFINVGIKCIESRRSIWRGFSDEELSHMDYID
jgi:hypothetical protein